VILVVGSKLQKCVHRAFVLPHSQKDTATTAAFRMQCSTLNLIVFIPQVEVLLHGTMQPASRIPGRETGMHH